MKKGKKAVKKIFLCYLPILLFAIFTIFPFYWMLCTALKEESTIMELPIRYWPKELTLDNFQRILTSMGFDRYFLNSLFVSVITTILIMVVAIWGGFALSRYNFRGKKFTFMLLLVTQMLPGVVILIPLFTIFNNLGLINNLWSLIIVNTTVNLPFCMIMMKGFFSGIPSTLEEAAQIDGCSIWKAIFRVVLPAVMPGVVSSGCFAFVNAWNEFVYALNFINDSNKFTLPVGLSMMKGEFTVDYGGLAAGVIVALIPVLLIFCYIQKYLVQGLSAGAVKG